MPTSRYQRFPEIYKQRARLHRQGVPEEERKAKQKAYYYSERNHSACLKRQQEYRFRQKMKKEELKQEEEREAVARFFRYDDTVFGLYGDWDLVDFPVTRSMREIPVWPSFRPQEQLQSCLGWEAQSRAVARL